MTGPLELQQITVSNGISPLCSSNIHWRPFFCRHNICFAFCVLNRETTFLCLFAIRRRSRWNEPLQPELWHKRRKVQPFREKQTNRFHVVLLVLVHLATNCLLRFINLFTTPDRTAPGIYLRVFLKVPFLTCSCGYGVLDKSKYPFWSVGALSTSNKFFQAGPVYGCGYVTSL